jgi:hypothetical protein
MHQCSDGLISGHPCQLRATEQAADGQWWCARHSSEGLAWRVAEVQARERGAEDAFRAASDEIQGLLDAIGVEGKVYESPFAPTGSPPIGAVLSIPELRSIVTLIGDK